MNPPTTKSGKAGTDRNSEEDFAHCFSKLYKRFGCPVPVTIDKEYQSRDNKSKISEGKTKHKNVPVARSVEGSELNNDQLFDDLITIRITAIYDTQLHLSEILIAKFRQETIPRVTIQLLALILSNYQQLSKFTIKDCRIDRFVVHELGKVLTFTTITDVCLDDCPLREANYEVLLNNPKNLKNLSLCRCNINDAVCEQLASKLHFLEPAEKNLVTLNLTSNCIGDQGAKYIAEALRSNRHLRYLNLADNLISDEGASLLFKTFIEFPLTPDENLNRRRRYMVYLKKKHEIYLECLKKLTLPQNSPRHSRTGKTLPIIRTVPSPRPKSFQTKLKLKRDSVKSLSEDNIPIKAELAARDLVGPFVDPFCPSSVKTEDGIPHSFGNFALCYLNIAYNDLTYASVKTLLAVVKYQEHNHSPSACGLLKVILEGNYLPVHCTELITIQKILNKFNKITASHSDFFIKHCISKIKS